MCDKECMEYNVQHVSRSFYSFISLLLCLISFSEKHGMFSLQKVLIFVSKIDCYFICTSHISYSLEECKK